MYKEFDYELNRTTHYEYDADGGLLRTYTIDANGKNILQIEYPQKGSVASSVRYIIDGVILDELDVTADEENNTTTLTSHAGIVTTTTDDLGRVIGSILQTTEDFALMESYSYLNIVMTPGKADTSSSTYVSTLTMADGTVYGYSYDSIGNITRVTENGVLNLSYQYDGQGQLVREDNVYANATYAFTYDGYGNILTKSTYGYTLPDAELPTTAVSTNTYSYGDPAWPDLLKEYNGEDISYDDIGNPVNYYNGQNFTFTWEGRTLVGVTSGENSYSYEYNSNSIRVQKVANSIVHKYTIDGTKILAETYGDTTLNFYYDENDSPIAFSVNGTMYYYGKNLQGDVVKIYSANGEVVAEYTYDAWGKLLAITDANGNAITDSTIPAVVNPIRYRGYYYDVETGFYYLNSRYYDANVGRFLNADDLAFLGVSGTVLGYNLYGYCENEPVNSIDMLGYLAWPGEIHRFVQNILSLYIWLFLGCFTYSDYFIRFSRFKYGFADLYAKKWNEIWEVKPNKKSYKTSGPKQLKKYLDGIKGAKKGRDLGIFKTYYYNAGFYEVIIYSVSNDGMIYYDYHYCWKVNATIVLAVSSIVLIATGYGASAGVPMLSRLLKPA